MICLTCKKIYRPERNGVYFEEMAPSGQKQRVESPVGGAVDHQVWGPYKLWVGDKLKCPGCGHEVIAGVPLEPVAEHYQAGYQDFRAALIAQGKLICEVADCGPLHLGNMQASGKTMRKLLRRLDENLTSLRASIAMALQDGQRMQERVDAAMKDDEDA